MFYALLGDRPKEKGESDGIGHGARSMEHGEMGTLTNEVTKSRIAGEQEL